MKKSILVFTVFFLFISFRKPEPEFSYKVYGNIANYFENKEDLLSFFHFQKGDHVAEIGALDGANIAGLAILTDSIDFYAEDINSKTLTQKNFNKQIRKAGKYKNPLTCTFHLVIGNEKASLLPDQFFDKIFLSATFHEFTEMDAMLEDIHQKLKTGGNLYVLESHCFNPKHKNYSASEITALLEKHGFRFVKKDGKDLNSSQDLCRIVMEK